jgi:heme exporter protein D
VKKNERQGKEKKGTRRVLVFAVMGSLCFFSFLAWAHFLVFFFSLLFFGVECRAKCLHNLHRSKKTTRIRKKGRNGREKESEKRGNVMER